MASVSAAPWDPCPWFTASVHHRSQLWCPLESPCGGSCPIVLTALRLVLLGSACPAARARTPLLCEPTVPFPWALSLVAEVGKLLCEGLDSNHFQLCGHVERPSSVDGEAWWCPSTLCSHVISPEHCGQGHGGVCLHCAHTQSAPSSVDGGVVVSVYTVLMQLTLAGRTEAGPLGEAVTMVTAAAPSTPHAGWR